MDASPNPKIPCRVILVLSWLLLTAPRGQEQWPLVLPTLHTIFTDIEFQDEKSGWGTAYRGELARTSDGGKSWERVLGAATQYLVISRSMQVFEDTLILMVENSKVDLELHVTQDRGSTWKILPVHDDAERVRFVDGRNGWAVGTYGLIQRTRDGGETWQTQFSESRASFTSCFALDSLRAWIGGPAGEILYTQDGGRNWLLQDDRDGAISALHFTSPTEGIAIGIGGTYFRSRDGGKSWTRTSSEIPARCSRWTFVDSATQWCQGGGSNADWLDVTRDGGLTWSSQSFGMPLRDVQFLSKEIGVAQVRDGEVWTRDGGATWSRPSGTAFEGVFKAIHFLDESTGWAGGTQGNLMRTTDGGRTWEKLSTGTQVTLNCIRFADREIGWIAGDTGVVLHTLDGGKTWRPASTGTRANLVSLHFVNRRTGFAAGSAGTLLKTVDGGASWDLVPTMTTSDLKTVQFLDELTGWVAGPGVGTFPGLLMRTQDGGGTWDRMELTEQTPIHSVQFMDEENGYGLGKTGFFKTTNGGNSWRRTLEFPSGGSTASFHACHFPAKSIGACVGQQIGYSTQWAQRTTDAGETWSRIPFPAPWASLSPDLPLEAVYMPTTTSFWAAGQDRVLHIATSPAPVRPRGRLGPAFSVDRSAPDRILLSLDLPAAGRMLVQLHGTDGRRPLPIAERKVPAGEQTVEVPIADLAPGVHILEVQSPGFRRFHKLVSLSR